MQAEQLMIGDWVLDPFDEPTRISAIHNFDDVEINKDLDSNQYFAAAVIDLNPVPITGEILEQNGWKHFSKDNQKLDFHNTEHWLLDKCEAWRLNDNTILYFRIQSNDHHTQYGGKIQYVHELQHALRLCGIEKDIAL